MSVLTPPTIAGSVNVNIAADCYPLEVTISVPVTGTETAAQHCEALVQAIKGSSSASQGYAVAADQCGTPARAFAVSNNCGVQMTVGISTEPAFSAHFDQTYLGPLADGESDNIVAGPPPAVPLVSTWFLAAAASALGAAGLLGLGRARTPGRATRRVAT